MTPTSPAGQPRDHFFESVFHTIDQVLFVVSVRPPDTFVYQSVNETFERHTGVSQRDVAGRPLQELGPVFTEAGVDAIRANYRRCVETGEVVQYEERLLLRDTPSWWLTRLVPMTDEDGRVHQIIGSAADITHLKRVEGQLAASRQQLASVLESSLDGIMLFEAVRDEGGAIVDFEWRVANPASQRISQRDPAALIGKRLLEEMPGNRETGLFEAYVQVVETGAPYERELHYASEGVDAWIQLSAVKVDDGFSVTFRDITAAKQQEHALQASEERLEMALHGGDLGLWDWDLPTGHVTFNERWAAMLGYAPDEIDPHVDSWSELVHPADQDHIMAELAAHLEGRVPVYETEHRMRAKDGTWRWILDKGRVVERADDGTPLRMVGTHLDITERKVAEHALQERETFLDSIYGGVDLAVFVVDVDADGTLRFADLNARHEELTGLEADWIRGRTPEELAPRIPAEATAALRANYERCLEAGEPIQYEEAIPVDGRQTWWLTRLTPLRDEHGTIYRIVGTGQPIDDLKQTQHALEQARDAAQTANRAKSAFLANMSHEIRTPMNGILGFADLLSETPLNTEQAEFTATIYKSAGRLLRLINDILDLSKIEAGHMALHQTTVNLVVLVEEVLKELSASARQKGLELTHLLAPDVPRHVLTDPDRLQQVLTNLLSNAIKFTTEGEVALSVSCSEGGLLFTVRDTGIGIPEDQQEHLFQAFYQADDSLSRQFEGTGLGLAISQQLVEMMGGRIWCESMPGTGSAFYVQVPLQASTQQTTPPQTAARGVLDGQRALIVDDNETNRRFFALQLRVWGLHSITCASGAEALSCLDREGPFDVALLDDDMPYMRGAALAAALRERVPNLPLVLLSSAAHGTPPSGLFDAVLTKPVARQLLRQTLEAYAPSAAEPEAQVAATHAAPAAAPLPSTAPARNERSPEAPPTSAKRILVAEDDPTNQRVIAHYLRAGGYPFDVVSDGLKAIEALTTTPYDLVLMDVRMPHLNGLQTTQRIHELYGPERPPIVALTAQAMPGDAERFLAAGMDAYLPKPVSKQDLLDVVERLLQTAAA